MIVPALILLFSHQFLIYFFFLGCGTERDFIIFEHGKNILGSVT